MGRHARFDMHGAYNNLIGIIKSGICSVNIFPQTILTVFGYSNSRRVMADSAGTMLDLIALADDLQV